MAELEEVSDSEISELSPADSARSGLGTFKRKTFLVDDEGTSSVQESFPAVVPLNVGGYRYMTRLSTLCKYPDSMLSAMFSGRHRLDKDAQGSYFIDSNGSSFGHILEFLRNDTIPPNDVASVIYREACYYNIAPLIELLQTTPSVSRMIVHEAHRVQFPDYKDLKQKVIRIAMDNATVDKTGEVLIHAFRKTFEPKAPYFNLQHECVADGAHVSVGPWNAMADEEALMKCLEHDLMTEGFHVKPHEARRRCKYYNGQNCQKCVYKITIIF